MSNYAIGDIQGCYDELEALLKLIQFDSNKDRLWFAGDLICRGPKSLKTLRFVKMLNLKQQAIMVLGNHEMTLLALHYLPDFPKIQKRRNEFLDVLSAPDCDVLCHWLTQQPFFYEDKALGYVITHAGIFPKWTIAQARSYAGELEKKLRVDPVEFFSQIYGDSPKQWQNNLKNWDRYRFIANALTRMRFCTKNYELDFEFKGEIGTQPINLMPWFKMPNAFENEVKLLFGHWAALKGITECADIFALDGGCIWGGELLAMRLEDQHLFKIPCFF